jgi:hypothetical protein
MDLASGLFMFDRRMQAEIFPYCGRNRSASWPTVHWLMACLAARQFDQSGIGDGMRFRKSGSPLEETGFEPLVSVATEMLIEFAKGITGRALDG